MKYRWSAVLGFAAVALASAAHAQVVTWATVAGAAVSGNAVDAQANFLRSNGFITITVISLQSNPTADTQLISGISFDVSGLSGSGSVTTVNQGKISSVHSGGAYSTPVSDPLARWKAGLSGSNIYLNVFTGGKPDYQIIGPDNHNGFNPLTGAYSSANSSILQHEPVVVGSATFTLKAPGLTTASSISNVEFQFGTASDTGFLAATIVPTNQMTAVPEPNSAALLASVVASGGIIALARRRRRK